MLRNNVRHMMLCNEVGERKEDEEEEEEREKLLDHIHSFARIFSLSLSIRVTRGFFLLHVIILLSLHLCSRRRRRRNFSSAEKDGVQAREREREREREKSTMGYINKPAYCIYHIHHHIICY